jgi:hypothetical protein
MQADTGPRTLPNTDPMAKDDFSDPKSGWSTDVDDKVSLEYAEGGYRILVKNPGAQDSRWHFGTPERAAVTDAMIVQADATQRSGPRTSDFEVGPFEFHGVACWGTRGESGPLTAYKFVLTPDGYYAILKQVEGVPPETLDEGQGDFGGYGATNVIEGACVPGGGETTTLTMSIDGQQVAFWDDRAGIDTYSSVGLTVFTSDVPTDVRFDNVVVHPFDPKQGLPPPAPVTTGAIGEGPLCTADGARYVGKTTQGARVCFTLAYDARDRWLDYGYSFIPESGCPQEAVGDVPITGPGFVDAAGNIEMPGFSAEIHGPNASGVFFDEDICPGKKFKWKAHLAMSSSSPAFTRLRALWLARRPSSTDGNAWASRTAATPASVGSPPSASTSRPAQTASSSTNSPCTPAQMTATSSPVSCAAATTAPRLRSDAA